VNFARDKHVFVFFAGIRKLENILLKHQRNAYFYVENIPSILPKRVLPSSLVKDLDVVIPVLYSFD
jgi:hypothetical protein